MPMPDGLTHVVAGYVFGWKWLRRKEISLYLLGCLIPDILLRGGRLLFIWSLEKDFLELYLVPLHTPIIGIFVCVAITQFFYSQIRKKVFLLLYSGCFCHYLLDLFQRTIDGYSYSVVSLDGYQWFFPFTRFDFQVGIFWPENSWYGLIILIPTTIFISLFYKRS